jgi:hypothetical protein
MITEKNNLRDFVIELFRWYQIQKITFSIPNFIHTQKIYGNEYFNNYFLRTFTWYITNKYGLSIN